MKATLKNYHQTPRKTRLVAKSIKGKRVPEALLFLSYANKRAAHPLKKLIESAAANARKKGEAPEMLVVKNITVDKGLVMKKYMPRARGSASPIRRRMAHVTVELAAAPEKKAKKAAKPAAKKGAKAKAA